MTDKELDDLEAWLREFAEEHRSTTRDRAEEAADAIAELRKKNAGLVGALDRLMKATNPARLTTKNILLFGDDLPEARALAQAALKENTQ